MKYTTMRYFGLFVLTGIFGLSGCSSSSVSTLPVGFSSTDSVPALGNVEYHTFQLANELFMQVRAARQTRYAVVSFVPIPDNRFDPQAQHPLQLLGHQLREGLITEASKRGYSTQEFLLTNDIKVSELHDRVLSKDVDELTSVQQVDYYITGTILHQQEGAMVNARIINVRNKEVVAAATRFFPAGLFWRAEEVTTRNGRLYRSANNSTPR